MNGTKIAIISVIVLVILALSTTLIANIRPQMHKTSMLENIIYKRSK